MSTKSITVRVDEETKFKAEAILDEIGINVTTLINTCLKAVIREKRVPFALVSNDYAVNKIEDDDPFILLKPDPSKTPVLGKFDGLIEIPDDFDEPLEEMKEYMY